MSYVPSSYPFSGNGHSTEDLLPPDMYSIEVFLFKYLAAELPDILTKDPYRAALHFVPQFSTHEYHFCRFVAHLDVPTGTCARRISSEYFDPIARGVVEAPWFPRAGGSTVVFVFPWDFGRDLVVPSGAPPPGLERAITIGHGPGTSRREKGNAVSVDNDADRLVVAPNTVCHETLAGPSFYSTDSLVCDAQKRSYFLTFAGSLVSDWKYSRGVRQTLFRALAGVDNVVRLSPHHVNATRVYFKRTTLRITLMA